jgi:hypothetical protein
MDQGGAVDEDVILSTDGLAIEFKGFAPSTAWRCACGAAPSMR